MSDPELESVQPSRKLDRYLLNGSQLAVTSPASVLIELFTTTPEDIFPVQYSTTDSCSAIPTPRELAAISAATNSGTEGSVPLTLPTHL